VFHRLGLPIAPEKTEGPATVLSFLGIEIDTIAMEIRLPAGKLQALQATLNSWVMKRACTRRELESLLGSLGHACCVVREGKTFMHRLFELLSVTRQAHHYLRLNMAARSDLCWWQAFLAPLNQASFMRPLRGSATQYAFATDASGSVGCGAIWQGRWFQLKWACVSKGLMGELGKDSITFKELIPIVMATGVWGPQWKGSLVMVYCDNEGAAAVVNSGYSKVPRIMHLLRCLFFVKARFNIELSAVYLPGRQNLAADAISRDHLPFIFSQVPATRWGQVSISPTLLELLLDPAMDWTSQNWRELFGTCFPPGWPPQRSVPTSQAPRDM
jgi:hypothetical protein